MLPNAGRLTREGGKRLLFKTYCAVMAPAITRQLAERNQQRVSVICYHRVNDELKDNVTVAVDQFDWQMSFIKKRYHVVSLNDVVGGRIDRSSRRPIVVVTFDDGYIDNYENAFPVLQKREVPAHFFVSTGIIDSNQGFAHDREKLGRPLPTMSWGQLRELRTHGHEIGAHTVNHANLAKVGDSIAYRELTQSRDAIRRELGYEAVSFAYCFGGRLDITEPRRALVKELGFTCCCAAYGGTNTGALDLFDIKRFGVNWALSGAAFQARIEGLG